MIVKHENRIKALEAKAVGSDAENDKETVNNSLDNDTVDLAPDEV